MTSIPNGLYELIRERAIEQLQYAVRLNRSFIVATREVRFDQPALLYDTRVAKSVKEALNNRVLTNMFNRAKRIQERRIYEKS